MTAPEAGCRDVDERRGGRHRRGTSQCALRGERRCAVLTALVGAIADARGSVATRPRSTHLLPPPGRSSFVNCSLHQALVTVGGRPSSPW
jgi:hypothetical protein